MAEPMPLGPRPHRLVRVEHIMGTAISVDVRDRSLDTSAVDAMFEYLRDVDDRFSPYRSDSEVNRLGRGELALADGSADLRQVLVLCEQLRASTAGNFDARAHRSDGMLDPTGVVKGWAVEQAAWMLEAAGARNFAINAGGDVVTRGRPEPGRPWRVGIRHPIQADRVATVMELCNGAVATSGNYERGTHIRQPRTGRPAMDLLSLSVIGPSLTYADAYATAAFAMGSAGPAWVAGQHGYGAIAVTLDQQVVWTPLAWDRRTA